MILITILFVSYIQANGNKHSNKDDLSLKTSSESSTAPIPKINTSNSAVEEPDKNEEKTNINNENQKKNIVKVKRVRRKVNYFLHVYQDVVWIAVCFRVYSPPFFFLFSSSLDLQQ